MDESKFHRLFKNRKPLIGMIHLSGDPDKKIDRAIYEIKMLSEEGFDAALVEDYHGSIEDACKVAGKSAVLKLNMIRGLNLLGNPYLAFGVASKFNMGFIQFDSVQTPDLDIGLYDALRKQHPNVLVLGGVGFKYTAPTGNPLETDLREARARCDAIVTTGEGTGIETPLAKLHNYKRILKDFPLIVGAGVNERNIYDQLSIADGAIIGSSIKTVYGDTNSALSREKIRRLVEIRNKLN